MFVKFAIPEEVMSYGGAQFSFFSFQNFAKHYGFYYTSRYAQSNGEAERALPAVKNLLKKLHGSCLALLVYRTSPLKSGYISAKLLTGSLLCTRVPILPATLNP